MKPKQALPKLGELVWLLGLSISLTGCGGSGGSSQTTTPHSDHAVLETNIGFGRGGYSVTVSRDGTATYTVTEVSATQPTFNTVTGSGTVSPTLTGQFFSDLDTVAPTYQPPNGVGGGAGAGSSAISYSGKMIAVGSSSDPHQQALYDEYNAIVKALNIPTLPQY